MSRLAVKTYVAQQLALLNAPVPCDTYIQRPKEVPISLALAVVVSIPDTAETRMTLPRAGGLKRLDHKVGLDIYWTNADPTVGGTNFDEMLDQMDALFRKGNIQESLTDPESGAQSTLYFIGEVIDTHVFDVQLVDEQDPQGMQVYTATKTVAVTELLYAGNVG